MDTQTVPVGYLPLPPSYLQSAHMLLISRQHFQIILHLYLICTQNTLRWSQTILLVPSDSTLLIPQVAPQEPPTPLQTLSTRPGCVCFNLSSTQFQLSPALSPNHHQTAFCWPLLSSSSHLPRSLVTHLHAPDCTLCSFPCRPPSSSPLIKLLYDDPHRNDFSSNRNDFCYSYQIETSNHTLVAQDMSSKSSSDSSGFQTIL